MSGENIQGRIRSVIDILPTSERKIGLTILDDPSAVISMTAAELSKVAGTSPATVIRFCKKIDIPSFTQLKIKLSAEIETPIQEGYSDITENESIPDLKSKLLANAYQSMQETVALLNDQRIEQVVDLLIAAPIIYVYGVGASYLVAENIAQKWNRGGKTVICIRDPHILITIIISAPKDAVFFGISNSGETKEVLRLVDIAKKYQLHTIGLSQFGSNSLATKVDLPIQTVRSNEAIVRSAATTSLHDQFIVIDILFYAYASRNFNKMIDRIQKSKEEVHRFDNRGK
ncbi:DNA-binding MurR/RpiR family transcriptional regulator [Enterococcus sp. PF1-24]|uniref:MurR/RpiR family transcriptional regulator n=1 Tax=unclassified Enterococcus TaxID=2608891 RepID=UPI002474976D|nr:MULTISPECIES: MurR/RpiR family transcriptional regulator [unclassified Enterococcus]MDH6364373.1 DNA-binding MurR/RpiR family transcriptional regulator [Enterococcus sp. PFB1-1]MDH6401438.1 DNA-binding MurR/RpiR family transcriptional regulator [Enterococcus sp. PF1-24]